MIILFCDILTYFENETDEGFKTPEADADGQKKDNLVVETLSLLEEGRRRMSYHPKKEYVLIVGKAGTGE
jgi:hypothetical protein